MGDTRTRDEEILARIEAWAERHAGHVAGGVDCGCSLYDDVIWSLPEFDPLDPPPSLASARLPRWTLLDGRVIDGTGRRDGRPEWRIISPGEA
jgi:hypothetical protein